MYFFNSGVMRPDFARRNFLCCENHFASGGEYVSAHSSLTWMGSKIWCDQLWLWFLSIKRWTVTLEFAVCFLQLQMTDFVVPFGGLVDTLLVVLFGRESLFFWWPLSFAPKNLNALGQMYLLNTANVKQKPYGHMTPSFAKTLRSFDQQQTLITLV